MVRPRYGLCGAIGIGAVRWLDVRPAVATAAGWVPFVVQSGVRRRGERIGQAVPRRRRRRRAAGRAAAGYDDRRWRHRADRSRGLGGRGWRPPGLHHRNHHRRGTTARATTAGRPRPAPRPAPPRPGPPGSGRPPVSPRRRPPEPPPPRVSPRRQRPLRRAPLPTKIHDANAATQTLVLTFIAASIPKLLEDDRASETNPNARSGLIVQHWPSSKCSQSSPDRGGRGGARESGEERRRRGVDAAADDSRHGCTRRRARDAIFLGEDPTRPVSSPPRETACTGVPLALSLTLAAAPLLVGCADESGGDGPDVRRLRAARHRRRARADRRADAGCDRRARHVEPGRRHRARSMTRRPRRLSTATRWSR